MSAYTNYSGLLSVFTWPIAAALAVGLQAMIAGLGYRLTCTRERALLTRQLFAWGLLASISIYFSYSAVDSAYHRRCAKLNRPLKLKQSLIDAAQQLSDGTDEARRLALARLANELRYANQNAVVAEARLQNGAYYAHAADGEVGLRTSQEASQEIQNEIKEWNTFQVDTSAIAGKPAVDAWASLQSAHTRLSTLWGTVPWGASPPDFKLPPYPTPPAATGLGDDVEDEESDAFLGPFQRLTAERTAVQVFFLALAAALELSPILLAWSGAVTTEERSHVATSADAPQDGCARAGTRTGPGHARSGEDVQTNETGVLERTASPVVYDAFDGRVNLFGARRRLPYQIDSGLRGWEKVDELVAPSIEAAQRATAASLSNVAVKQALDATVERIRLFQDAALRHDLPTLEVDRLIHDAWEHFEAEIDFERAVVEAARLRRRAKFFAALLSDLDALETGPLASVGHDVMDRLRAQASALAGPFGGCGGAS